MPTADPNQAAYPPRAITPVIITPTVGRVVHFYPNRLHYQSGGQPFKADIAYVHGDRLVNVSFLYHDGTAGAVCGVVLVQPGDPIPEAGGFCKWMDYQIGQAVKTESVQSELERVRADYLKRANEAQKG